MVGKMCGVPLIAWNCVNDLVQILGMNEAIDYLVMAVCMITDI